MFKKVKSLLVAGLLVVSMSGNVFANESDLPVSSTSVIENPDFNEEGKRVVSLQGGQIIVELTKKDNGDVDIKVKWHADNIKITGVKSYYVNKENEADMGSIDHTNYFETWYHCNTLVKGEDGFYTGTVIGGIQGKELVKVEIMFDNLTKGDEPVTPPEEPEEPEKPEESIKDPETGDVGIMGVAVIAVASAAGLYLLKNKEDEE